MLTTTFVSAGVLEMLLPLGLGFFLWKKFGAQWKVFFVGVFAFMLSQIIHIPLLYSIDWLFSRTGIEQNWSEMALLVLNAVVLGAMAALCEEPLRWLSFKWMKTESEPFRASLALGAGHGGVESFLVGISVIGSAFSLILWQAGSLPIPEVQVPAFQALSETAWYLPLLGVFERIAAMTLHMSLSSLVWLSFRQRKTAFFMYALLLHFVVDAVVVFLAGMGWSALALEGVMVIVMAFSAWIIYQVYAVYGKDSLYAPSKQASEPMPVEAS